MRSTFTKSIFKTFNFSTGRFNANDTNFSHLYPRHENISIGIHLYALQIVPNIESINFNCILANISNKHLVHHLVLIEREQLKSVYENISQLLIRFWQQKELLNVLIIFHRHNEMQIASYNPFASNQFTFFNGTENLKTLFPDKTSNLNGLELKATIYQDRTRATFNEANRRNASAMGGADGLMAQLIVQFMNSSLQLLSPSDGVEIGEFLENGHATGCLGQLVRREVNFGVNIRFYRLGQFKSFLEATTTNGRDDICILVPRAGKATDIGNIFRAFSKYDWIAIAVSWPAVAFTYRFIDVVLSRRHNRPRRQTTISIFFDLLALNFGQSTHTMPANWLKKSLIGVWLIYTLLITSLYQSMLSGNLVIPKDLPDINSIEQLDQSQYKIISYPRYNRQILDFLKDTQFSAKYRRLPQRLINVTQDEFFAEIRKNNQTIAYANKHHINVYLRRMHRANGEVIYNEMKQCPVPYVTIYGLPFGSPYKGRINYIIRQAQENGLIEKWDRIDKIKEKISQSKLRGDRDLIPFSFHHLRTAFFVFLIGCMVAGAVFFMELSIGFRRHICDGLHFPNK